MKLIVGGKTFMATLADTPSAKAFVTKLPLTLDMAKFGRIALRKSITIWEKP